MNNVFNTIEEAYEFLFWIATLQSNVFEKGRGALQPTDLSYCCLGVAEPCMVDESLLHKNSSDNRLYGVMPYLSNQDNWLKRVIDQFSYRPGSAHLDQEPGAYKRALIYFNDETNETHAQIADRLLLAFTPDLEEIYNKYNHDQAQATILKSLEDDLIKEEGL